MSYGTCFNIDMNQGTDVTLKECVRQRIPRKAILDRLVSLNRGIFKLLSSLLLL